MEVNLPPFSSFSNFKALRQVHFFSLQEVYSPRSRICFIKKSSRKKISCKVICSALILLKSEMGLLDGKRGIISGLLDEKSIAYFVAKRCLEEGARIIVTNVPVALRLGTVGKICKEWGVPFVAADLTNIDEIRNLLMEAKEKFWGEVDFFLHSVAMSPNVRKNRPYVDLSYEFLWKTLDVSAVSLHKFLQVAYSMDVIEEWGSVVTVSYIASSRVFPGYNDMAEAKALLESIVRSFGYYYGVKKKVRVNAISQSPTRTTAGTGISGFESFYRYAEEMSPLGNAPAEACANLAVFLFSDLSRYITMQTIYCDGGFHAMGISEKIASRFADESPQ